MLFLNQRAETGVLVAMNSHKTTTVAVNSQLLKPYRQATKILGIPVGQLVEEFLNPFKGEPEQIGEEFRWISYPMHECALAAAERFEAFAIEEKPKSNPDIGMVATEVLEREGHWAVKPDYLSTSEGSTWRTIASDLWGEEED
jgi:hypothetical protein